MSHGRGTATVNYATEKAKVSYSGDLSVGDLIATAEATGYTAQEPAPPVGQEERAEEPGELRLLRRGLVMAVAPAVPSWPWP